jgi:beta-glucosidase
MAYGVRLLALAACVALSSCISLETSRQREAATSEQVIEARAQSILSRMSVEEKVGQIIQADISSVTPDEVRQYNLGSVLNGGNSAPGGGEVAEPEAWIALADAFWEASTDTSDGGAGVPVLWGTDAVHGHNNLQYATIFPHNSALGATHNPALIEQIARVTAREVRATGLDWTFAPTLAVARDDRWGRTYESYSENPEQVAEYADAMVRGLQGSPGDDGFLQGEFVIATAKHFIGDGGTELGIDKGDTRGEWDEILRIHGAGYRPAIDAQVQTIMASFSSVNGEKMHGAQSLLTDVLRGELGFTGFVIGDWNGHAEVPGCTATRCPQALNAGVDMYMAPDSWRELYHSLLEDVASGVIPMERLNEAVLRILRVKIRTGLLDAPRPSARTATRPDLLGHSDHRQIARRAVRESLVLLKNEGSILPFAPDATVLVAGSGANSMQQQTGGWTLNWQGVDNANDEFVYGQTIYEGIAEVLRSGGGRAILSETGESNERPDVAIVVFGEDPYAEYLGDRTDLVYEFSDGANLRLIRSLRARGIPVVSVFLTGRPLWVNPLLNASDAFVVAWLPGTEGGGVADVLFAGADGRPRHDFRGRLSFSWPAQGSGRPINDANDAGVLFPFGYGSTYAERSAWVALSEDSGTAPPVFTGRILERGNAAAPFRLYLGDSSSANAPVTGGVAQSVGGAVQIRALDYRAQEDARELTWLGSGEGVVKLTSGRPLEVSGMGDARALALEIEWRINEAPQGDFFLAMGCGDGCEGRLPVAAHLRAHADRAWRVTQFPLQCFVDAGLDVRRLTTGLALVSDSPAQVVLHAARIVPSRSGGACQ